jgi:hypothetical protein
VPFTEAATKQKALDRICDSLNIRRESLGPGSTEPTGPLREACRQLGLSTSGSKPELAQNIAESAGLIWDGTCDSRRTPSGGGATVTLVGLNRVLEALERRVSARQVTSKPPRLGEAYREATEDTVIGSREPYLIDLSELDRATRLHARTQNKASEVIRRRGLSPMSPGPTDPQFDLAWCCSSGLVVAEVKTVQPANHIQQVRLGLGQVIEYRHRLSGTVSDPVVAVLILSAPPDPLMRDVCRTVQVIATDINKMETTLSHLLN